MCVCIYIYSVYVDIYIYTLYMWVPTFISNILLLDDRKNFQF